MKLLFDQNISHRILKIISNQFEGSATAKSENLIDSSDKVIWEFAKKSNYIIVTQDSDFNDLNLMYGFPPKIIWVRTGNIKTEELSNLLKKHYTEIEYFEANKDYGCFEIVEIRR